MIRNKLIQAFVDGAKWWEFTSCGGTMWQSDQRLAEKEALKKYKPLNMAIELLLFFLIFIWGGILLEYYLSNNTLFALYGWGCGFLSAIIICYNGEQK